MSAFIWVTLTLLAIRLIFSTVFIDKPIATPSRKAVAIANFVRLAWIIWGLWLLWGGA